MDQTDHLEQNDQMNELLEFFKALSDANRLKIIGLLAQQEYNVEQLAELLNVRPSTVSHHLSKLTKAGLVSSRAESYYNIYRLETSTLEAMSKRLMARETLPAIAADVDVDAYDRKVLNAYMTPEGTFKEIPSQYKKLKSILRYLAQVFEFDRRYSEKEVNEILSRYNEDYAQLRREMVEMGLMAREGGGGAYWRVPQE